MKNIKKLSLVYMSFFFTHTVHINYSNSSNKAESVTNVCLDLANS
jgi:hypothetical protein